MFGFDWQQILEVLVAIAVAWFGGSRVIPPLYRKVTTGSKPTSTDLLVKEHEALLTLKERAKRRGCDEMKQATQALNDCFMQGKEPGDEPSAQPVA